MNDAAKPAGGSGDLALQNLLKEQIGRIVEALERRNDLVASLHKLSDEQQKVIDNIVTVGRRMGVRNFTTPSPPTTSATPRKGA